MAAKGDGEIDLIVERLATVLKGGSRSVVVIEGPSGSGKTYIANRLVAHLRPAFADRTCRGDKLDREVADHVLDIAANQPLRKDVADFVADAVEDLGDLLAEDGIPFGKIAHRVLKEIVVGGARGRLSEVQQRFVSRLLTIMPGKRPLLLADDLQYWDSVSLLFLHRVLRGDLDRYFPRLKRLAVILVLDPARALHDQKPLLDALIAVAGEHRVGLAYPALDAYAEILGRLGLEGAPPPADLAAIHAMTGGNLALSRLVVDELQGKAVGLGRRASLATGDFSRIIERRLETLREAPELAGLISLLAATLDLSFDELACALRCTPEAAVDRALQVADRLSFVSVSDGAIRLRHESLQPLLASAVGQDGRAAHRLLAGCLARLRPGDYGRRAAQTLAAGDLRGAEILSIMDRLAGIRQGRFAWTDPLAPSPAAFGAGPIQALANRFDQTYACIAKGSFGEALVALDGAEVGAPLQLAWEVILLRAQILGEMNEDACVDRSIGLLEELDAAKTVEPELWGRAKESEVVALSNLRRVEEARLLEGRLREVYQTRAGFDPSAALALNRLRRGSEAVHSPHIAHDRLETALKFFAPETADGPPAYPAEYIATLNNLCANELLLGRFTTSRQRAHKLVAIDTVFIDYVLRRPEVVWSNVLLCELMNGKAAAPIADAFASLVRHSDLNFVDGMLIGINAAAAVASAGRHETAVKRLEALLTQLEKQGRAQPYVTHFLTANLAVAAWAIGYDATFARAWALSETSLGEMSSEYTAPFLAKRLEVLQPELGRPGPRDVSALDGLFIKGPRRVGESWAFLGRPFLFTDIQFWADT